MTKRVTNPGDRARCNICAQWPKIDSKGALRNHSYPWYHSQNGQPCPGSGSQVRPLPGQLDLELDEYPEQDDYGRAFRWEANHSTGKHVRVYPSDQGDTSQ